MEKLDELWNSEMTEYFLVFSKNSFAYLFIVYLFHKGSTLFTGFTNSDVYKCLQWDSYQRTDWNIMHFCGEECIQSL